MKKQQTQVQEQLTAHQRKTIHSIFQMTIEGLEKYIEVAGYYPDWQTRKQIPNNEVIVDSAEDAEESFTVSLFGFKKALKDKPPFLHEELKEEFYKWVNSTGIDVNNCPERLKHVLSETHAVLEGGGERFAKETLDRAQENVKKMSDRELETEINKAFINIQAPLKSGRESEEVLSDKKYNEISLQNKFSGSIEQGKQSLGQITGAVSASHDEFHFFPQQQQRTNSEIIQDIRQNPQNWRIDEIITEFDNFGRTRQEKVLIHQSARLDDYNQQTGKLNLVNNPIYQASRFNAEEIAEINQTLNISQQSAQVQQPPYKWNF